MDKLTEQIARFATDLRYDHLGDEIADLAAQHLIDGLGCALGAENTMPATIARTIADGQTAGKYAGRTLFAGRTMPLDMAGFINSCMIRNYDFNDRFPGGHPSDGLGAHYALAGTVPMDGKTFLTAALITYEIFIRLSEASQLRERGWDQGFAVGISTAAAMCRLFGLSFEQTANAIGMTASSTVPLRVSRSGELTAWKNVATPFAGRNGTFAAILAAEGMPGPGSAFEGRAGLFENVTGPFELTPFPNEGGPVRFTEVLIKYWPLETNGQPVVWAALDMREKIPPEKIGDIEHIEIFCDSFGKHEIGSEPEKWDPQTRETADHSMPYIFARALVDGPLTVASFDEGPVRDPALRPLMNKIEATIDDEIEALMPEHLIVRAVAKMKDGTIHETESRNPPGHPLNPMSNDDIAAKFRSQAEPVIGADRCGKVIEAWSGLKDADDLRPLIAMMDFPGN